MKAHNLIKYCPLLLIALLGCIPLYFILAFVSPLPNSDFWNIFYAYRDRRISNTFYNGFFSQNGHNVTIPGYFEILAAHFFAADNRIAALLNWLLALLVTFSLYLSQASALKTAGRLLFSFTCTALIFSPAAAWNYLEGYSEICWFLSILSVVLTITAVVRYFTTQRSVYIVTGIIILSLGCFSHSNAFMLWPALILLSGPFFLNDKKALISFSVAAVINFAVRQVIVPAGSSRIDPDNTKTLLDQLLFIPAYLGAPLSDNLYFSAFIGLGLLVLFVFLFMQRRKTCIRKQAYIYSGLLGIYAVLNGVVTQIFRIDFNFSPDISRYALFPSLFYLSLVILAIDSTSRFRSCLTALGTFTVLFLLATSNSKILSSTLKNQDIKNLAALGLINDIKDPAAQGAAISAVSYTRFRSTLFANQLYPFGNDLWQHRYQIGQRIERSAELLPVQAKPLFFPLTNTSQTYRSVFELSAVASGVVTVDNKDKVIGVAVRSHFSRTVNSDSAKQYFGYILGAKEVKTYRHFVVE